MSLLLKLAWRELSSRKVRTILTLLGLAIGVVSATAFDLIGTSVYQSSLDTYQNSVASDLVTQHQVNVIPSELLVSLNNLTTAELGLQLILDGSIDGYEGALQAVGVSNITKTATKSHATGIYLVEGRIPFPGNNELLVDFSDFKSLNLDLGMNLSVVTTLGEINYTIVGVAADPAAQSYNFRSGLRFYFELSDLQVYDPNEDFANKTNLMFLEYEKGTDLDLATLSLVEILVENNIQVLSVIQKDLENDWRSSFLDLFNEFALIVSISGLVIGGIFTANTLAMTILQSKKEIGIMKTIGGKPNFLLKLYITEIAFYGILGAIIGVPLSLGLTLILMQFYSSALNLTVITLVVTPTIIFKGLILSIIAAFIFGLFPVIQAIKQPTIKTIRPETKTETGTYQTRIRGSSFFFAWRNIKRHKIRTGIIFFTITMSLGIGIGTTAALDSAYDFTTEWIETLDFDYTVGFPTIVPESIVNSYVESFFDQEFPGLLNWTEGSLWLPGTLLVDNNPDITFAGLHPGGYAYQTFEILEGRKLQTSDRNDSVVVVTGIFADKYGLNVGELVSIDTPYGKYDFTVVGVVQDLFNQGAVAYVPINYLRSIFSLNGMANSFLIKLTDSSQTDLVKRTLEQQARENGLSISLQTKDFWREVGLKQVNFFQLFAVTVQFLTTLITIVGSTNILIMIALERRREFAVLKMLGGRPRYIFGLLNFEAGLIGFAAGVSAIPIIRFLGDELLHIASSQLAPGIPYLFGWSQLVNSLVLGVLTGVFSAIIPSIWVTKASVAEGLRYE